MTMNEARAALVVPADKVNNNCVQDAAWRLRDALKLAERDTGPDDAAPCYVTHLVGCLASWVAL